MSTQAPTVRSEELANLQLKVRYQSVEALKGAVSLMRTGLQITRSRDAQAAS